jgi:hypothetical protein
VVEIHVPVGRHRVPVAQSREATAHDTSRAYKYPPASDAILLCDTDKSTQIILPSGLVMSFM